MDHTIVVDADVNVLDWLKAERHQFSQISVLGPLLREKKDKKIHTQAVCYPILGSPYQSVAAGGNIFRVPGHVFRRRTKIKTRRGL